MINLCLYVPILPVGVGNTAVVDIVATTDDVAAIVVPIVAVTLFTAESVVPRVVLTVEVVAAEVVAAVVIAIDWVDVDVTFPSVNKFNKHPNWLNTEMYAEAYIWKFGAS